MINTIFFTTICFIIGMYIGYTFAYYLDNKYTNKNPFHCIKQNEKYSIVEMFYYLQNGGYFYVTFDKNTSLFDIDYVKQRKSKKCDKGR